MQMFYANVIKDSTTDLAISIQNIQFGRIFKVVDVLWMEKSYPM
jgi:hypothetical protein